MAGWNLSAQIKILPDAIPMKSPVIEADHSAFSQFTVGIVAYQDFASVLEAVFIRSKCNGKVYALLTVIEANQAITMSESSVILYMPFPGLLLLLPLSLLILLTMVDQDISSNASN